MLQDENDELREENENLIMQIDNITFQFEAELEKLNIENKELEFKLLRSGIFIKFLKNLEEQLKEMNKQNKRNEDVIRDLKREMTFIKIANEVRL